MSEIFRIARPAAFRELGLTTLAWLAHRAEDTDDDVLLLQVVDEVASRGREAEGTWHEEYLRLMSERRPLPGPAGPDRR